MADCHRIVTLNRAKQAKISKSQKHENRAFPITDLTAIRTANRTEGHAQIGFSLLFKRRPERPGLFVRASVLERHVLSELDRDIFRADDKMKLGC